MPAYKRSLLYCAIAASTSVTHLMANSAFDAFVDDTTVNGRLRTVYYNIDNRERHQEAGAWSGALWLNLESGYLADIFAIGGTFYGVTKFYMDDKNSGSYQLLIDKTRYNDKGDSVGKDGQGYGKLGQAWVDLKIPDAVEPVSGNFRAGRQLVYTGLISSSGSRSAQSTWQGYKLAGDIYGVDFGLAYVDQMSLRNQSGFHDLTNFSGKKIDHIVGGELSYTIPLADDRSLKLKYRNAFAKDYLQAHNGEIRFNTPLSYDMNLTVGGKYYRTKKDGDLWEGSAWYSRAFDNKATAVNLFASLEVNSWTISAGFSHIKAETSKINDKAQYQKPGRYYYDFGKNTHGIWDLNTSGFAEDMIYDGENVWMIGVSKDFSDVGIEGLELGYAFHYGSGMEILNTKTKQKKDTSEYENDFYAIYKFPQPMLKGMKLKMEYGIYRNDDELRKAINKQENDLRVWLDYNFTLF